jgi:hypothetical protein
MNKGLPLFLLLWLVFSCKQPTTSKPKTPTEKSYLPLLALITHDLQQADANAGGILLRTRRGQKKDSSFISHADFKKEANRFLRPELDSVFFQDHYEETSLMDETTGMINFIYTPKSGTPAIQKVIVYIKPGLSTDQVNRIYLEIEEQEAGRNASLKMTWKMNGYFIIAASLLDGNGAEEIAVKKVIWNPEYFSEE